jgi:hypothetical protein
MVFFSYSALFLLSSAPAAEDTHFHDNFEATNGEHSFELKENCLEPLFYFRGLD